MTKETWAFVVTRNNSVEQIRLFTDLADGEEFANNFIKQIDPNMEELPVYSKNESYFSNDLSVGLYQCVH